MFKEFNSGEKTQMIILPALEILFLLKNENVFNSHPYQLIQFDTMNSEQGG